MYVWAGKHPGANVFNFRNILNTANVSIKYCKLSNKLYKTKLTVLQHMPCCNHTTILSFVWLGFSCSFTPKWLKATEG
jgi:hypothetical protein